MHWTKLPVENREGDVLLDDEGSSGEERGKEN